MTFKKNAPGCKCCGVPPCSCVSVSNYPCQGGWPSYAFDTSAMSVTVAGLTNDDCTDCDDYNGTFELCYDGNGTWSSEETTSCGLPGPRYSLVNAGSHYVLSALAYTWSKAAGSWNCSGVNTLSLDLSVPIPIPCGNMPATVTVRSCALCPHCTPTTTGPERVQVDLAGIVSLCAGTVPCSSLNSTFVLEQRYGQCNFSLDLPYVGGGACGWNAMQTSVNAQMHADGWTVGVGLDGWDWDYREGASFNWSSGGTYDCSIARVATLDQWSGHIFCEFDNATCTITPL